MYPDIIKGLELEPRALERLREEFYLTPYLYGAHIAFRPEDAAGTYHELQINTNEYDFYATRIVPRVVLPAHFADPDANNLIPSYGFSPSDSREPEYLFDLEITSNGNRVTEPGPANYMPFHSRKSARVLPQGIRLPKQSSVVVKVTKRYPMTYIGAEPETLEDEIFYIAFHGVELRRRPQQATFSQVAEKLEQIFNFDPYTYAFKTDLGIRVPVALAPAVAAPTVTVDFSALMQNKAFLAQGMFMEVVQPNPAFALPNLNFNYLSETYPTAQAATIELKDDHRKYQNEPILLDCFRGSRHAPIVLGGDWVVSPVTRFYATIVTMLNYPQVPAQNRELVLAGNISGTLFNLKERYKRQLTGNMQNEVARAFAGG